MAFVANKIRYFTASSLIRLYSFPVRTAKKCLNTLPSIANFNKTLSHKFVSICIGLSFILNQTDLYYQLYFFAEW